MPPPVPGWPLDPPSPISATARILDEETETPGVLDKKSKITSKLTNLENDFFFTTTHKTVRLSGKMAFGYEIHKSALSLVIENFLLFPTRISFPSRMKLRFTMAVPMGTPGDARFRESWEIMELIRDLGQ